jgi:ATP-dependent RNA helicase DeaD
VTKFSNFPLLPSIQKALDALGFTDATPIQAEVIPLLLAEPTRHIYAQAQTGTGKTLAFGIPLLQIINTQEKKVQALILAPTRELVLQISESLSQVARGSGVAIEAVFGGMPIQKQIHAIKSGAHIVVGTPGRINDHLRRKTLTLGSIKTFVLDEADIMLDMGFKEDIDVILQHAPKECPIWLFSATFKPAIKSIIASYMKNPLAIRVAQTELINRHVGQYYCIVPSRQRVAATVRFIEADPEFYGIIFCQTKAQTSEVKDELVAYGFRADCLHGDMSQALRNKVIRGFKKKDFTILVATDVAARGIDVSDLTHVINMSIPREHDYYVHRIGRTGRAGKEGTAILFVSPSERSKLKLLERMTNAQLKEINVPSAQDLINKTAQNVASSLEELVQKHTNSDSLNSTVESLLAPFSPNDAHTLLVELIKKNYFKKHNEIDFKSSFSANQGSEVTRQELCIDLGKQDGLSEKMVQEYLEDACNVNRADIQKLRILDTKTFIELDPSQMQGCLETLKNKPLIDRKYKVYITEDTFSRGGQRPSGNRSGGYGRNNQQQRGYGRSSSGAGSSSYGKDRMKRRSNSR